MSVFKFLFVFLVFFGGCCGQGSNAQNSTQQERGSARTPLSDTDMIGVTGWGEKWVVGGLVLGATFLSYVSPMASFIAVVLFAPYASVDEIASTGLFSPKMASALDSDSKKVWIASGTETYRMSLSSIVITRSWGDIESGVLRLPTLVSTATPVPAPVAVRSSERSAVTAQLPGPPDVAALLNLDDDQPVPAPKAAYELRLNDDERLADYSPVGWRIPFSLIVAGVGYGIGVISGLLLFAIALLAAGTYAENVAAKVTKEIWQSGPTGRVRIQDDDDDDGPHGGFAGALVGAFGNPWWLLGGFHLSYCPIVIVACVHIIALYGTYDRAIEMAAIGVLVPFGLFPVGLALIVAMFAVDERSAPVSKSPVPASLMWSGSSAGNVAQCERTREWMSMQEDSRHRVREESAFGASDDPGAVEFSSLLRAPGCATIRWFEMGWVQLVFKMLRPATEGYATCTEEPDSDDVPAQVLRWFGFLWAQYTVYATRYFAVPFIETTLSASLAVSVGLTWKFGRWAWLATSILFGVRCALVLLFRYYSGRWANSIVILTNGLAALSVGLLNVYQFAPNIPSWVLPVVAGLLIATAVLDVFSRLFLSLDAIVLGFAPAPRMIFAYGSPISVRELRAIIDAALRIRGHRALPAPTAMRSFAGKLLMSPEEMEALGLGGGATRGLMGGYDETGDNEMGEFEGEFNEEGFMQLPNGHWVDQFGNEFDEEGMPVVPMTKKERKRLRREQRRLEAEAEAEMMGEFNEEGFMQLPNGHWVDQFGNEFDEEGIPVGLSKKEKKKLRREQRLLEAQMVEEELMAQAELEEYMAMEAAAKKRRKKDKGKKDKDSKKDKKKKKASSDFVTEGFATQVLDSVSSAHADENSEDSGYAVADLFGKKKKGAKARRAGAARALKALPPAGSANSSVASAQKPYGQRYVPPAPLGAPHGAVRSASGSVHSSAVVGSVTSRGVVGGGVGVVPPLALPSSHTPSHDGVLPVLPLPGCDTPTAAGTADGQPTLALVTDGAPAPVAAKPPVAPGGPQGFSMGSATDNVAGVAVGDGLQQPHGRPPTPSKPSTPRAQFSASVAEPSTGEEGAATGGGASAAGSVPGAWTAWGGNLGYYGIFPPTAYHAPAPSPSQQAPRGGSLPPGGPGGIPSPAAPYGWIPPPPPGNDAMSLTQQANYFAQLQQQYAAAAAAQHQQQAGTGQAASQQQQQQPPQQPWAPQWGGGYAPWQGGAWSQTQQSPWNAYGAPNFVAPPAPPPPTASPRGRKRDGRPSSRERGRAHRRSRSGRRSRSRSRRSSSSSSDDSSDSSSSSDTSTSSSSTSSSSSSSSSASSRGRRRSRRSRSRSSRRSRSRDRKRSSSRRSESKHRRGKSQEADPALHLEVVDGSPAAARGVRSPPVGGGRAPEQWTAPVVISGVVTRGNGQDPWRAAPARASMPRDEVGYTDPGLSLGASRDATYGSARVPSPGGSPSRWRVSHPTATVDPGAVPLPRVASPRHGGRHAAHPRVPQHGGPVLMSVNAPTPSPPRRR